MTPAAVGAGEPATAGRERGAPAAILAAAGELFMERSPGKVTLRDIADRAGVNYGLIHRHFGTKDELLTAIFRQLTAYAATHLEESVDAIDATEHLLDSSDGGFARMFTSVVLDDVAPEKVFGDRSAAQAYTRLLEDLWRDGPRTAVPDGDFDPRVVAAVVMLNGMVWDLFAPYLQVLAGLEDRDLPDIRSEVLRLMQRSVLALGPGDG
ncbi:MAG: helix-turn-helix domain-containing protein [Acidimicrobiia bacterium]|jgi:AcrR family transcriptional regulator